MSEHNDARRAPTFDSVAESGALVLNRYVVESLLGYGAAGVVYLGRTVRTGVPVAIKIQHADNAAQRPRFEREAILLARINNPHVVGVVDFGSLDDGAAVVVMEYVDGVDVGEFSRSRGGWLPWREAAHIGVGLLDGLDAAHEAGVLHRDVKPENVLICNGAKLTVKLVDFGIARTATDEQLSRITGTGQLLGSLAYMAPEQIAGDPVDARTDVYGAGTLLFELLTGKLPFEGAGMRMGMAKLASVGPTKMPVPQGADPWPPELEGVVLSMLRSDPNERPATAYHAKDALVKVLHGAGSKRP